MNGFSIKYSVAGLFVLVAMLGGAAFALYPVLLPSSLDPAGSLTIGNAASGTNSLAIGLWWWGFGIAIALGYFVLVYTMFRGKVTSPQR